MFEYLYANPICISICSEIGRYSLYVLNWNTTMYVIANKTQLHLVYYLAQTKTVIRKWLAKCFTFNQPYYVYFTTALMKQIHFLIHLCLTHYWWQHWMAWQVGYITRNTFQKWYLAPLYHTYIDIRYVGPKSVTRNSHVTNAYDISCHSTCTGNTTNHTSLQNKYWINL